MTNVAHKRILVVDDEEGMRITLAANLELEGYEVVEAKSGAEAVAFVEKSPFTLVLTDIQMPGLSGLETYRAIRKARPEQIVLMMTGFAVEQVVDAALLEGAYAVLVKPFDVDQLVRIVECAARAPAVLILGATAESADQTARSLRGAGVPVTTAVDTATALNLIRERAVDTCVLAHPEQSQAASLASSLWNVSPDLNVIALVGGELSDPLRRLAASTRGACLRQPVALHDLIVAVARLRAL